MRRLWYYTSKALGDKAGRNNREADIVATIRLLLILQAVATNIFIVAGVIKHWN